MKKYLFLSFVVVVIGVNACGKKHQQKITEAPSKYLNSEPFVSGEIVVQLKNPSTGFSKNFKNQFLSQQNFVTVEGDKNEGVYLLQGKALAGKEKETIAKFEAYGEFKLIEPNFKVQVKSTIPRDPRWLELWALKNYGQDAPSGTEGVPGADIQALEAWKINTGSKKVIVAVIDTGIDYTHPDLKDNIWINAPEKNGTPGVDDDGNGYVDDVYGWDFVSGVRDKPYYDQLGDPDPMDDHGHGTHVAGTIGAVGNNTFGVTGINWHVSIMALKFLDKEGSGNSFDQYRALKYMIKMGVDIANASYGGGAPSKLVENTLREAGEKGLLFVAAAGNERANNDENPSYPSSYPIETLISVAATDNRDQLAGFSNYGFQSVHLAAPGVGILSTYPVALALTEGAEDPYKVFSGTSMASPHVAGAAALVLAGNPDLKRNPKEIKRRLLNAVEWMPNLASRVISGGRLNLPRALTGSMGKSPQFEGGWQEEAYALQTPRYPRELLDQTWVIQKEGARAIKLHIGFAMVDNDFDFAFIYDQLLRPIVAIPSLASDLWLPPILGDTAILKFSNASVSIQKFQGEKKVTEEEMKELFQKGLSSFCYREGGETLHTCLVYDNPSTPFANFTSEGINIDRIRYLPGEVK